MKKILIISLGVIILIGIVTVSAISLIGYSKIGERTTIDAKSICNEKVPEHANQNACGNNIQNSISLQNSNLKIDVLRNNQTNKEILHIYSK